jgi:hypothetical protein
MSTGLHIFQFLKIQILEATIDLLIIITIIIKIQFLITIVSISTKIKLILLNKPLTTSQQPFLKKSHLHNDYFVLHNQHHRQHLTYNNNKQTIYKIHHTQL